VRQELRFCTAPDGVRLAYATSGHGPAVVKAGHWMTHLERDWTSPVWRHWVEFLSQEHTLVRYDERGCGLSDREYPSWPGELGRRPRAVVDAAGVDHSACSAQRAVGGHRYAVRHPDRVTGLVLYSTYTRAGRTRSDTAGPGGSRDARLADPAGLGKSNRRFGECSPRCSYRVSDAQTAWFDELQRASCSGERGPLRAVRYAVDVSDLARAITVPTLVLHRDDAVVPSTGAQLASLIPVQFVPLGAPTTSCSRRTGLDRFSRSCALLPAGLAPQLATGLLTDREIEVLRFIAQGSDNDSIAAAMHLSVRTVERHLSNCYAKLGVGGKSARAAAAARLATLER
jgi:DNA-binding CsgD family transcriptional regulator/pimeloyl-ACP methyl ester carboxylesterase